MGKKPFHVDGHQHVHLLPGNKDKEGVAWKGGKRGGGQTKILTMNLKPFYFKTEIFALSLHKHF